MFIDVAGFTGLSERMGDRVVPLWSRYLDVASEVIVAHGGTIDKFIGDAVMAFWGAPTAQADHALLCSAAAQRSPAARLSKLPASTTTTAIPCRSGSASIQVACWSATSAPNCG
jgi:class 3 adenylate cyclase